MEIQGGDKGKKIPMSFWAAFREKINLVIIGHY
jgi:hypothetical protein